MANESQFDRCEENFDLLGLGDDFLDLLQMSESINPFELPAEDMMFNLDQWIEDESPFIFEENYTHTDISNNQGLEVAIAYDQVSEPGSGMAASASGSMSCSAASSLGPASEKMPCMAPLSKAEKRRFEDCLSEFVGTEPVDKQAKRRKAFTSERRKEVEQVRKAGACTRCKLMKIPCKLELPCESCIKACNDTALGRTLCVREKLMDVRFKSDLWGQSDDTQWLKEEVSILYGPKTTLTICLADFCDSSSFVFNNDLNSVIWLIGGHDGPWTVADPLEIEVQEFHPRRGEEYGHISTVFAASDKAISTALRYYAIPEHSLPRLETLEAWALDTARNHPRAFIGGIRGSFLQLARRYCECKRLLPLQDLLRKAIRLTCLHGIWFSDLPLQRDPNQESHQYASNAVHRQISLIVSKGIVDAEVDILALLQTHIFSSKGPGKGNMLPIWTCLWLLILTYQRTMDYYPKSNGLYQLAQHMYDMLVSVYSGLFRPSSPLWLNWLRNDVFELFGRDWRITEAMGTLKTEIGHYSNGDGEYQSPRDILLRSLVFNHEKKLGKKLMEKPYSQDLLREKYMSATGKAYYLVEASRVSYGISYWA